MNKITLICLGVAAIILILLGAVLIVGINNKAKKENIIIIPEDKNKGFLNGTVTLRTGNCMPTMWYPGIQYEEGYGCYEGRVKKMLYLEGIDSEIIKIISSDDNGSFSTTLPVGNYSILIIERFYFNGRYLEYPVILPDKNVSIPLNVEINTTNDTYINYPVVNETFVIKKNQTTSLDLLINHAVE